MLREVYAPLLDAGMPLVVTDLPTAELVKVAANAFLATKISFINAMAEVCEAAGADVTQLAEALALDPRIGGRFLHAGLGFGGGCLPKDIRAFMARAGELGVDQALTLPARRSTRSTCAAAPGWSTWPASCAAARCSARAVAVLGAAFKPNSDDIRDSPALDVAASHPARRARRSPSTTRRRCDNAAQDVPDAGVRRLGRSRPPTGADVVLHLTEWHEFRDDGPRGAGPRRRRTGASSTAATRSTRRGGAARAGPTGRSAGPDRRAPPERRPRPRLPHRVPCGMRPPRRALNRASGRSSGAPLPPASPQVSGSGPADEPTARGLSIVSGLRSVAPDDVETRRPHHH